MNRSLTKLCRVIALSISGGMSHHVLAFSGHCFSSNGPHQYSFAMNQTVTDVTQVAPGKTLQQSWNENGKYTAWCDNTPGVKSVTYFKAEAGPNMIEAPGNNRFYYIPHTNNILSVQTHMDIVGNGSHRVPFIDLNNHAADDHSNPKATWSSGSSGYITVRVEKEITTARIVIPPTTVVAQLWGSHVPGSYGAAPLVQVVVAGTIVVPQYCTVNAGDVVDIQLGDSWAEDFQTPGEKPNGYTPVTTTIKAHCDNTLATEQLNLGMHATEAEGSFGAIKTTKEHLGIMLTAQAAHSAETPLLTNMPTTRVPFQLEENSGEATITLRAWPVKTTSGDLTPGDYRGVAILDIYTP